MDNHKELFGWATAGIANAASAIVAQHQVDEYLQTATLVIGLIAGVLSIMYSSYKWYHRATHPDSHGGTKITFEEIKEVTEAVENVNKNK